MKLVVTPQPHLAESILGYTLRLTEANGYPTPAYLLSALQGTWYRSTYGRLDAAALEGLVGLSAQAVSRLTMRTESMPRSYIKVVENELPAYEVSLRFPKVCPFCLDETAICESFWDLAQAVACPRHQVKLVDRCPSCSQALTWSRSKVTECSCGADLRKAPTASVCPLISDLMGALRFFVYRDESVASMPERMSHLRHLSLRSMCKLLWVMTSARYEKQRVRTDQWLPKSRAQFSGKMDQVAAALSDWPSGFQEFLGKHYEPSLTAAAEQRSFRTLFSWLFFRLIKHDSDGGDCYRFLADEAYRFGARFWTRGALSRAEGRLPPDLLFRWVTMSEVVESTGVHAVTLNRMIQDGEVPDSFIQRRPERRMLIDLDWVRAMRTSSFPAVPLRDAAKRIGLSIGTLRAMRGMGIYQVNYWCRHRSGWAQEDVEDLRERLRALSCGKTDAGAGSEAAEMVFDHFRPSPAQKAAFYGKLLSNPALVLGYKGHGFRPGNLQVATEHAVRLLTGKESGSGLVTAQVAAKRLKCSADVITGLKRAGHLKLGMQHGREAICVASLVDFEENYESLAALAKRVGACIKRTYHRLDMGLLKHIRVSGVQHTTTFIHCEDWGKAEAMISVRGCITST